MESPKADAMGDELKLPLGKVKDGSSGGVSLPSGTGCRSEAVELNGSDDGGIIMMGRGTETESVRPPHVLGKAWGRRPGMALTTAYVAKSRTKDLLRPVANLCKPAQAECELQQLER